VEGAPSSAENCWKSSPFYKAKLNLFMLVSALMGIERMQAAYAYAIDNGYRFYSYGDASLLLP
jgi:S-adenosylmethionine:tRNA ribosyltransferase-isomerase